MGGDRTYRCLGAWLVLWACEEKKSRFQVFQHSQPSTTQEVSAEALIRRQEATRFTYLLFTEHYSFKVRTSAEFL